MTYIAVEVYVSYPFLLLFYGFFPFCSSLVTIHSMLLYLFFLFFTHIYLHLFSILYSTYYSSSLSCRYLQLLYFILYISSSFSSHSLFLVIFPIYTSINLKTLPFPFFAISSLCHLSRSVSDKFYSFIFHLRESYLPS